MSTDAYLDARREGLREAHALQNRGEDPSLIVLAELLPDLHKLSAVPLGLTQISIDQIVGTVTKGRTAAFSRSFLPLLEPSSEFAIKWSTLYSHIVEEGQRDPIQVYEYYNRFYVAEGNKRVSVMRRLDSPLIEASVTRILPAAEDSLRYRIYREFLRFYQDTHLYTVNFSREDGFARLYALTGKTPGTAWTGDELDDFSSCYFRFCQAFAERAAGQISICPGDAFLIYLDVFGYHESLNKSPGQFSSDIDRIRSEFLVSASQKPAAMLSQPATRQQSLLHSVLRKPKLPLRCAFIYNSSPQESGWTYWHELGRKALEETFGSRVETTFRERVSQEEAQSVIDELVELGYDVIFAASPVFTATCIRQAAEHPQTHILSCSLLANYHNVRSYYLRIYEAKFILGAIAGSMTENDRIGYIADYPIYGTPASINAFALGAQLTNPRAKIILEWSTLPGHHPENALAAQDVHIISSRDISAPKLESRAFGLYEVYDHQINNLAMPVWNWSTLYEGIVRSILSDAWGIDDQHHADRALSYYMGMSSGAIDLVCSKRLPPRLMRLADLLHERLRSDALLPFIGPIADQQGTLRVPPDVALMPDDIIHMDYLADNVIGRIPKLSELNAVAQGLVSRQGIRAAADQPDGHLS